MAENFSENKNKDSFSDWLRNYEYIDASSSLKVRGKVAEQEKSFKYLIVQLQVIGSGALSI